eukprot:c9230_g2_i1.p1 GENE.c9230_g2_i1~~c9230_g2_i1.p1  ORF type:complete len:405 (+),score=83.06 c9230_g2_i1:158-1216(+)
MRRGGTTNDRKTIRVALDQIFVPGSQDEIFDEVTELVQSALDGYHVCLFAYGQTGSGKTFTMEGVPDSPQFKGVIPRSLEQIFTWVKDRQSKGWHVVLQCMFIEIYNETLQDLLAPEGSTGPPLTIRTANLGEHSMKFSNVEGATCVTIDSEEAVRRVLAKAAASRTTARTNVHNRSSRSHVVFQLGIHLTPPAGSSKPATRGILNLIDLAGSERVSATGEDGTRLGEAKHINKSLSALADVISALANGESHVPYRNSKLTRILEPSLTSPDVKILMFCNLSPEDQCLRESLCTLRFASVVNRTCLFGDGTGPRPVRNKRHTEKVDLGRVLRENEDDDLAVSDCASTLGGKD